MHILADSNISMIKASARFEKENFILFMQKIFYICRNIYILSVV